jgi:hypothetical protein
MNPRHRGERKSSRPYVPSPKDIRRACEHIQLEWSDRERSKRSGDSLEGQWTPPCVIWSALTEAVLEDQGSNLTPNGNSV